MTYTDEVTHASATLYPGPTPTPPRTVAAPQKKWNVYEDGKLVFSNTDYDVSHGYMELQLRKNLMSTFVLRRGAF